MVYVIERGVGGRSVDLGLSYRRSSDEYLYTGHTCIFFHCRFYSKAKFQIFLLFQNRNVNHFFSTVGVDSTVRILKKSTIVTVEQTVSRNSADVADFFKHIGLQNSGCERKTEGIKT